MVCNEVMAATYVLNLLNWSDVLCFHLYTYDIYVYIQLWTVDADVTWNLVRAVFSPIEPNPIAVTKYASRFGPPQAKGASKYGPPNVDLFHPNV